MSRDHRKLRVFHLADELVLEVYRCTCTLPVEERFGLQSQMRRAAVSWATNIVEGCARTSTKDYLRFVNISLGSACEVRYLAGLANRLGYMPADSHGELDSRYTQLIRSLQSLLTSLESKTRSL